MNNSFLPPAADVKVPCGEEPESPLVPMSAANSLLVFPTYVCLCLIAQARTLIDI